MADISQTGAPKQAPQLEGINDGDNEYGQQRKSLMNWNTTIDHIRSLPLEAQKAAVQKLGLTPQGLTGMYEASSGEDRGSPLENAKLLFPGSENLNEEALKNRIAQASLFHQFGPQPGDWLGSLARLVFPNAGKNTEMASRVVGDLTGWTKPLEASSAEAAVPPMAKSPFDDPNKPPVSPTTGLAMPSAEPDLDHIREMMRSPIGIKSSHNPDEIASYAKESEFERPYANVPRVDGMNDEEANFLGLAMYYESKGGQNIPNYRFDRTHTAQGYYQITNTNWKRLAPGLGITAPNAMSANLNDQTRVALALLRESGKSNWTLYNEPLAAADRRGAHVMATLGSDIEGTKSPLETGLKLSMHPSSEAVGAWYKEHHEKGDLLAELQRLHSTYAESQK